METWDYSAGRKGTNPVWLDCNMSGAEQKRAVEEVRDLESGEADAARGGGDRDELRFIES